MQQEVKKKNSKNNTPEQSISHPFASAPSLPTLAPTHLQMQTLFQLFDFSTTQRKT